MPKITPAANAKANAKATASHAKLNPTNSKPNKTNMTNSKVSTIDAKLNYTDIKATKANTKANKDNQDNKDNIKTNISNSNHTNSKANKDSIKTNITNVKASGRKTKASIGDTNINATNVQTSVGKLAKPQDIIANKASTIDVKLTHTNSKTTNANAKTNKDNIKTNITNSQAGTTDINGDRTNSTASKATANHAKPNPTNSKPNKTNMTNVKASRRKTKASIGDTNTNTTNAKVSMGKLVKPQDIIAMFEQLRISNPQPDTELHYANNFTLLVAIILSAQSTDAQVNKVTKQLFTSVQTPEDIIAMGLDKLKIAINSLGLYNAKATNILHLAEILVQQYHSQVPTDRDTLKTLPGVGQKTANVFLNVAYHQPFIGVDTHVARLSYRLGLLDRPLTNTTLIEAALLQVIPPQYHAYVNHWLVLHGRYICKAKQPHCSNCPLAKYCPQNGVTDSK